MSRSYLTVRKIRAQKTRLSPPRASPGGDEVAARLEEGRQLLVAVDVVLQPDRLPGDLHDGVEDGRADVAVHRARRLAHPGEEPACVVIARLRFDRPRPRPSPPGPTRISTASAGYYHKWSSAENATASRRRRRPGGPGPHGRLRRKTRPTRNRGAHGTEKPAHDGAVPHFRGSRGRPNSGRRGAELGPGGRKGSELPSFPIVTPATRGYVEDIACL